ncbi:hypothetical protein KEM56_004958 [Ascosphaera pollenicola]|nr:hypothetical protein KEM56_004958 [Ascosphaera pollenicola]
MEEQSGNALKRPHPDGQDDAAQKRSRPDASNGSSAQGKKSAPDAAQIAHMVAEAKARAEAMAQAARARAAGGATAQASPLVPSPSPAAAPTAATAASPAMSRLEQMKARVAAATARAAAQTPQSQPALYAAPTPAQAPLPPPPHEDTTNKARGGLDVGLHPALLADFQEMRAKTSSATKSNRRTDSSKSSISKTPLDLSGPSLEETKANPYYDPNLGAASIAPKPRAPRQLIFNEHGKYIQQAAALRRQAQLENMKKRIAERARNVGIDEDLDLEKAYQVPAPPAIEWWDEGLVNGDEYPEPGDAANLKIDTPDSIVTKYVQHPVLLEPPQEKIMVAPKPMFLTPKEQAKVRRQRRMADLKEQQDKIRLGLVPAPPPKVQKSNLMRVLGEEAVKDPTAVEARVNREIAARHEEHVKTNEERKLTKEQRHEKLLNQQETDAARGIHMCVFKVDNLSNGRHRFKISKNAEQHALTGVCIINPRFNLIIVEGGAHSINAYKKLMLNRIDWTENAGPNTVREGNAEAQAAWLAAESENGELKDLSSNTCQLVWEGEVKTRAFRKWLGGRVCESDTSAKDTLARAKVENFWTLARSIKPALT